MTFVMRTGISHEWKEAKKQNKEKGEERNGGWKGGDGKTMQQERNQNRDGSCLRLRICSALFCPARALLLLLCALFCSLVAPVAPATQY